MLSGNAVSIIQILLSITLYSLVSPQKSGGSSRYVLLAGVSFWRPDVLMLVPSKCLNVRLLTHWFHAAQWTQLIIVSKQQQSIHKLPILLTRPETVSGELRWLCKKRLLGT